MGDELPGLQAEFEAGRRLLSPLQGRLEGGGLIEGLLDLHHRKSLEILRPFQGKPAGADLD